MYCLRSGTRMLQGRQNIQNATFGLYNTQLKEHAEISSYAARLVRKSYNENSFEFIKNNKYTSDFFDQLVNMGFICEQDFTSSNKSTIYLGHRFRYNFPLTALNIELTNMCNLRCRHCYGSFPKTSQPQFVPFGWFEQNLDDLNSLHVRKIALTGGESTIHPRFLDIAIFLLEHGFDLCVFTNGYNFSVIEKLLKKSENYHLMIKVSLDGFEDIHNLIRGSENAYSNALKTIEMISEYDNVTLYISTTILRENIDTATEFNRLINERFPNAIHTNDLAFPLGNANTCAFEVDEFPEVAKSLPDLFVRQGTNNNTNKKTIKSEYLRCTGGVSQCTLMPDGKLKICNAACDNQFYFKYNAYDKGLKYAWLNCGKSIKKFRNEKPKKTKECKKCLNSDKCTGNNCRVLAWVYTGNAENSNPLTCFANKLKS